VTSVSASPARSCAIVVGLRVAGAAIGALVQLGCVANSDGQPAVSSQVTSHPTQFIPCDAQRVLDNVCQQCHTNPPKNSAPFPLVNYQDTHVVYSGNPIWVHMRNAVESGVMPLPPVQIDAPSRDALLRWLNAGAPARTATDVCSDPNFDPEAGVGDDGDIEGSEAGLGVDASDDAAEAVDGAAGEASDGASDGGTGASEGGNLGAPDGDGDASPE
jgi:hypothetical protein